MDQVTSLLMSILTTLMSSGPLGWIAAIVVAAVSAFIWWKSSRMIKDAAQANTEKGRDSDQAKNAGDNAAAEKDADSAKEDIDKIVGKGDN